MKIALPGLFTLLAIYFPAPVFAGETSGTGSMIPAPLLKVWGEAYTMHSPKSAIKYKGTNPADGIKSLVGKEVDFSAIDMPMSIAALKKNGLIQFPLALGAIAPIVNLPGIYPGQLKLEAKVLADILLGNIKKWNDPVLVALNPNIRLPDADIIVVHRFSPPGINTIVGNYLAKNHAKWKEDKGDGMAGTWPATSIEVKDPLENIKKIKETPYAIGYGPVPQIMKNKLAYVQLRNQAGNFVSPGDDNISASAENAKWDESSGLDVVLTDQPGAQSWPLTFASYALVHKVSENSERTRELLKFFKYSIRYGGLKAVQNDFTPLPDSVKPVVHSIWKNIVDDKGVPVYKH